MPCTDLRLILRDWLRLLVGSSESQILNHIRLHRNVWINTKSFMKILLGSLNIDSRRIANASVIRPHARFSVDVLFCGAYRSTIRRRQRPMHGAKV